jgi:uncharacterized protein (DUF849 family)
MRNLMFMKETADHLFGDDHRWSALAAGRSQIPCATQAAMMGANMRVGLEDSLYVGRGRLASSNAGQVTKMRHVLEELGHEIATPRGSARNACAQGRRQRRVLTETIGRRQWNLNKPTTC